MSSARKIAFKTLGCRLNQFETDSIAAQFNRHDYQIVDFSEEADIYIVNTCTVTNQGDAKSRKAVSQATRHESEPVVVVTGCLVDGQQEQLQKLPGVTYFVGNAGKSSIFQLVEAHFSGETLTAHELGRDLFGFGITDRTFHTRSFIKIQDGCNNFCTFCIVPKVRGRAVSRPPEAILDNVRQVVDAGFREIVLTGVNIGRYEAGSLDFEMLVGKILEVPGDFRVRISSIEPEGFGDRLIDLFSHPKLNPHLHLCLQSGSDRILLLMRRFYNISTFMSLVNKIRGRYPNFNFTTDIIVGFPGETDEDFTQTCDRAREAGFSHIHTFKYSVRAGTRAERMPGQVPEKIKQQRSKVIRQLSDENKLNYYRSFIGKSQTVLAERIHPLTKLARGYGEHYIPVEFKCGPDGENRFHRVELNQVSEGDNPMLRGKIIKDPGNSADGIS
jgi:threonylcarbamoyladenosine tRNA methylthiotransferase MtaB